MSQDEFKLIDSITTILGTPGKGVLTGIGDDAAVVLPPSTSMIFCSDAMVEGVHFQLSYSTPYQLGHKSLAACLSDVAAMNGKPLYALVSLALPASCSREFIEEFYAGAKALAHAHQVDIVGGDLTASRGGVFIDVSCIGEAHDPLYRSGARPGNWVAVSGSLGTSAAGLFGLQSGEPISERLKNAHLFPHPRFDLLPPLNSHRGLCTSMIDISDGLSSELHHIAERSDVGFVIEESKLPVAPEVGALAQKAGLPVAQWVLSGGEDYELLVTLDQHAIEQFGTPPGFELIGRVTAPDQGLILKDSTGRSSELIAAGFSHF